MQTIPQWKRGIVHQNTFFSVAPWPFCWVPFISGISWMSEWEHLVHWEGKNSCAMGFLSSLDLEACEGCGDSLKGYIRPRKPCLDVWNMCTDVVFPVFCLDFPPREWSGLCGLDDSYHVFLGVSGEPGPCHKRRQKMWFCYYSLFLCNLYPFS